jgi:hypothetical protein
MTMQGTQVSLRTRTRECLVRVSHIGAASHCILSARLFLRTFHFFSAATPQRDRGLLRAYSLSCQLLQLAAQLDRTDEFGRHSTETQARMSAVAALCILRVLRSPLAAQVDDQQGERMCFEAIRRNACS